jgi:putative ABC transport system permease protein
MPVAGRAGPEAGRPAAAGRCQPAHCPHHRLEPDRGAGFMSFAPRVMVNDADVPATGLVQPASRVTYRLVPWQAQPGSRAPVQAWAIRVAQSPACTACAWNRSIRPPRDEADAGPRAEIPQPRGPAGRLLSAVAVALAARGFAASHLDASAMLRVLGQSQRTIAGATPPNSPGRPVCQRRWAWRWALPCTTCLCCCCRGWWSPACPLPACGPALGPGRGPDAAAGLWPAAGAATGPGAAAARDPARRGGAAPGVAGSAGLGVAGFAALLLVVSSDLRWA